MDASALSYTYVTKTIGETRGEDRRPEVVLFVCVTLYIVEWWFVLWFSFLRSRATLRTSILVEKADRLTISCNEFRFRTRIKNSIGIKRLYICMYISGKRRMCASGNRSTRITMSSRNVLALPWYLHRLTFNVIVIKERRINGNAKIRVAVCNVLMNNQVILVRLTIPHGNVNAANGSSVRSKRFPVLTIMGLSATKGSRNGPNNFYKVECPPFKISNLLRAIYERKLFLRIKTNDRFRRLPLIFNYGAINGDRTIPIRRNIRYVNLVPLHALKDNA